MGTRLFVYGTLMRGEYHHDFLQGSPRVGEAQSEARFELRLVDYYPALIEGGETAARGEIYDVDAATLLLLDELEDVPTLYLRVPMSLSDGSVADAYVLPRERAPAGERIPQGDFKSLPRSRREPLP